MICSLHLVIPGGDEKNLRYPSSCAVTDDVLVGETRFTVALL